MPELLALGDSVEVLEPRELRVMIMTQLRDTLKLYEHSDNDPGSNILP